MRDPAIRCGIVVAAAFATLTVACDNEPAVEDDTASVAEEEEVVGTNPHIDAADLCALVPLADVVAAVGGTEPTRAETGAFAPASCRYFFNLEDPSYGQRQMSASLQMLENYRLERMGAGEAALDVTDVGDEAWAKSFTDSYLLYASEGPLVFSINVGGGNSDRWPDLARSIAGVVLNRL